MELQNLFACDLLDHIIKNGTKNVSMLKTRLDVPIAAPLPPKDLVYSPKVFLGGLPVDCSSSHLYQAVRAYGDVDIVWPSGGGARNGGGYCFLIFADERSVNALVKDCKSNDDGYFKSFQLGQNRFVQVQVRPWLLADGDYVPNGNMKIDARLTVFVGGVPRTVRAVDIAKAMASFGAVAYAGIDVDAGHSYPKGAARISFVSAASYIHAMGSKIVQIEVKGENKTLQLKPYLTEDAECEECSGEHVIPKAGRYFCAEVSCLSYYCQQCWTNVHFDKTLVDRKRHLAYVRHGDMVKTVRVQPDEMDRY
ncbi:unnamed protein product [Bursaphelenchus okinawaensis]|uniref:RRM domain-containing protein n=1 Tax=Bursaphelenchus okinawaensis TaxID=465554 RepID=A0A811L7A7_9BILA|nr:unnamed protein product [Bursaphelenchus okinawaensis]CAG9117160.1 unnamed protein product [Bursaphelenchus okinawaensis]